MDYKAFNAQCKKGDFQRTYLFYGPERFMLQRAEKVLMRSALQGGDPVWNVSRFGAQADPFAVRDACEMLPVLGPLRIVRVEDCPAFGTGASQDWAEVVKCVPDTCILLFVQKDKPDGRLAPTKAVGPERQVIFDTLGEEELCQMIAASGSARGLFYQKGALKQLIYQAGSDAATLSQETQKLEAYAYPRKEITAQDVRKAAIRNEAAEAFDITDDLIGERWESAFERLSLYTRQGGMIAKLRGAVVFCLRELLTARLLIEQKMPHQAAMKQLKGPWLAREKTIEAAKRVSVQWVEHALCLLAEGDELHKTGRLDEQSAFEISLIRAFLSNKKSDATAPDSRIF